MFATVERQWLNNEHKVSAIPLGKYPLTMVAKHPHFGKCFAVGKVPDRSGIFMHIANWPHELEGCIAFGLDFGHDPREISVEHSTAAMQRLWSLMSLLPEPYFLTVERSSE